MIRLAYLDDKELQRRLVGEFLQKLDVKNVQKKWDDAKKTYPCLSGLTYTVKQLVSSDFGLLVKYAKEYKKVIQNVTDDNESNEINLHLRDKVFAYKGRRHDKIIAPFFMEHAEEMGIYTCHYCDTAYVNVYEYEDKKAGKTIKQSHFDLDHVIGRTECPIVSLSLFNLVPSCQVCNSRLKHDNPLEHSSKLLKKLSPTCKDHDFDKKVTIELMPLDKLKQPYLAHKDCYKIEFDCHKDKDYEEIVGLFRLNERYNYHRGEALRIKDLQRQYPPANIWNISNLLNVPYHQVEEDIFGLKFMKGEHRCFEKLKRDMMR